ncbi:MAG TPA: head GIN domain-containing protein [Sphingomicrobium sp.]
MRKAIVAGLLATSVATSGCARDRVEEAGPVTERNFQVGSFDRIELAGAYDATVRTGSGPTVQAKGGENILDDLVVEVEGNVLKVHPRERSGFRWGWGKKHSKIELTITVPSLKGAELAGSGGIRIDKISGDSFDGAVAGSGGLTVDQIDVASLNLSIAGSGDAKAGAGKVKSAEYDIAGSGGIDAKGVVSEDAKVSIAGSGGVSINATRTADVSIAGSGDVNVTGGAKCTTSKMGSGNINCS